MSAAEVRLAWDYPASQTNTLAGYRLYAHTNSLTTANLSNALVTVSLPRTNQQATIQFTNNLTVRWYFVATAVSTNGLESVPSNQVIVEPLPSPTSLRVLAVEYIPTITGTNWQDVGFFRLQLR